MDLIIWEDDSFVIINKPAGISTLADRFNPENILVLARKMNPNFKVCHRLDKNTSGLLVLAKNNNAYKYFSKMLERRNVHKIYHALVERKIDFETEKVTLPILTRANRSRVDFELGKPSLTFFTTLERYRFHSLVACRPITGRMHQIRIHLSALGLPICGDHDYGGQSIFLSKIKKKYNQKAKTERPLMHRIALHAYEISYLDPQGHPIRVIAEYPKDLQITTNQLKKNNDR